MAEIKTFDNVCKKSNTIRDMLLPKVSELRVACDEAETLTESEYWLYPAYSDLLFGIK